MNYKYQISLILFFLFLIISSISITSFIFPALIIESTVNDPIRTPNLFEMGYWSLPIIISSIIFGIFFIMYKKQFLPDIFYKITNIIQTKDISKRNSLIIILILFMIYIPFSIDELQREEFELGDYKGVKAGLDIFEIFDISSLIYEISTQLRYQLLYTSIALFDNVRIIPFVASIGLLLVTYFLTLEITKKRISAIISFSVLLQSNMFLLFDTTATYENFWILFYFISLYLVFKFPIGSPILFMISMFSKPLTIIFLPITYFLILTGKISKNKKIFLLITYSLIIALIMLVIYSDRLGADVRITGFDQTKFILALSGFSNSLRFDGLIIMLIIPTIILLANKIKTNAFETCFMFVGLSVMILSQPLLYSMTGITVQPYRDVPFIVMFAICIGIIFSNSKGWIKNN